MNNANQNAESGKTNWNVTIEQLIARSKKGNLKCSKKIAIGVTMALLTEAAIKCEYLTLPVAILKNEKLSVYLLKCNHRDKKFRLFFIYSQNSHCLYIIHTDDQNNFNGSCTDIFHLASLISQYK